MPPRDGGLPVLQPFVPDAAVSALALSPDDDFSEAALKAHPWAREHIEQPQCEGFPPGYSPSKAKKIWAARRCLCPLGSSGCVCKHRIRQQSSGGCVVQYCFSSTSGGWFREKRGDGGILGGEMGGHIGDSNCDKLGPAGGVRDAPEAHSVR